MLCSQLQGLFYKTLGCREVALLPSNEQRGSPRLQGGPLDRRRSGGLAQSPGEPLSNSPNSRGQARALARLVLLRRGHEQLERAPEPLELRPIFPGTFQGAHRDPHEANGHVPLTRLSRSAIRMQLSASASCPRLQQQLNTMLHQETLKLLILMGRQAPYEDLEQLQPLRRPTAAPSSYRARR
jgi:hypothetical protein